MFFGTGLADVSGTITYPLSCFGSSPIFSLPPLVEEGLRPPVAVGRELVLPPPTKFALPPTILNLRSDIARRGLIPKPAPRILQNALLDAKPSATGMLPAATHMIATARAILAAAGRRMRPPTSISACTYSPALLSSPVAIHGRACGQCEGKEVGTFQPKIARVCAPQPANFVHAGIP